MRLLQVGLTLKRLLLAACMVFAFGFVTVRANVIEGSATGLASPTSTITFGEISLPANTAVTSQYSGLGVSFSPNVYYDADIGFGFSNEISNFTETTEQAFVSPVVISFSTPQTSVDFQMAGDDSSYTFQAYLGGTLVDSFTDPDVGFASPLFYGFTNDDFTSIAITSESAPSGPYWDISNIQFGAPVAATPEPSSLLLLGGGLLGLVALAARSKRRTESSMC